MIEKTRLHHRKVDLTRIDSKYIYSDINYLISDILEMAGDFADEMPDFTGDEKERKVLIDYIMSLNNEETD